MSEIINSESHEAETPESRRDLLKEELESIDKEMALLEVNFDSLKSAREKAEELVGEKFSDDIPLNEILSDDRLLTVGGASTVIELRKRFTEALYEEQNYPIWLERFNQLKTRKMEAIKEFRELESEIYKKNWRPHRGGIA